MSDNDRVTQAEQLIARMQVARGYIYPEWELAAHMQRAIRLGATKEELFEVLEATLVPGGAPTFHRGLHEVE